MRAGMRGLAGMVVVAATSPAGAPTAAAGTYDGVACNAPGANGVNNSWSWSVGTVNNSTTPDDQSKYALLGSCASPDGLSSSSKPSYDRVRWGTFANFGFSAPAGTDITRVVLWRYGTGTVSTDDPNTPEKEAGRWEVNAQFDGNAPSSTPAIRAPASIPTRAIPARRASRTPRASSTTVAARTSRSASSVAGTSSRGRPSSPAHRGATSRRVSVLVSP